MKCGAFRFLLVGALWTLWVLLWGASSLHAQSLPNAGSIQQQIEREQQINKNQLELNKAKPKPLTELPPQGPTVVVRKFKFVGNTKLTEEELNQAVAGFLNRPLDFSRLQAAASAVMEAYRKKGWLVNAVLPPQDIDQGEITIQITEASFGAAQIRGELSTRVSTERILGIFEYQQPAGTPLNLDALDRALLLADDLPGVTVSGSLTEGALEGQTNLVLQLADEPQFTASVTSDNTGSVSTGANRVLANLTANSPSGMGDAMTLNILATGGTRYVRTGYSLPLGFDGWRLSANLSRLEYELTTAEYQALNAKGSSNAWGLELSYPIVRGRGFNLNSTWGVDLKSYFNQSGGSVVSSYSSEAMSLGLSGTAFDELGGGGANSFSLSMSGGSLNLTGSPTQSGDASTTQTEGGFRKLRYSLSRQQQLSANWSLYGTLSGQWSDKNLDSSEKFYLGGNTGVRAYPSNEGGGAWGQLAALELRSQLGNGYTLTAFYDWGQVTINPNNDYTGASALNTFALRGGGLALGWQNTTGLSLKAVVSQRVGTNPNPTTAGLDQDGTLQLNRFWLTASLAF
jgi:hemolysin activation/secretion protein